MLLFILQNKLFLNSLLLYKLLFLSSILFFFFKSNSFFFLLFLLNQKHSFFFLDFDQTFFFLNFLLMFLHLVNFNFLNNIFIDVFCLNLDKITWFNIANIITVTLFSFVFLWVVTKSGCITFNLGRWVHPNVISLKSLHEVQDLICLVISFNTKEGYSIALAISILFCAQSWFSSWFSFAEALLVVERIWILSYFWSNTLHLCVVCKFFAYKFKVWSIWPVSCVLVVLVVWLDLSV